MGREERFKVTAGRDCEEAGITDSSQGKCEDAPQQNGILCGAGGEGLAKRRQVVLNVEGEEGSGIASLSRVVHSEKRILPRLVI